MLTTLRFDVVSENPIVEDSAEGEYVGAAASEAKRFDDKGMPFRPSDITRSMSQSIRWHPVALCLIAWMRRKVCWRLV